MSEVNFFFPENGNVFLDRVQPALALFLQAVELPLQEFNVMGNIAALL